MLKCNTIIFSLLVLLAFSAMVASAAPSEFARDLYFGLRGDQDVARLQEFLTTQGYFHGPTNGNFFTLTRNAVKAFQTAHNIEPPAGYFGKLTRAVVNAKFVSGSSAQLSQITLLQKQISDLLAQIALLQASPASVVPLEPAATSTATIVEPTAATSTPAVVVPSLPSSFDSTLVIKPIYPSTTLSRYAAVTLNELTFTADEKIAITRLRFKNNKTMPDLNFQSLRLINSQNGTVLATIGGVTNGVAEFTLVTDASKPNKGLVVSGATYSIEADILTPNYTEKPKIQFDLEAASDVSAFDYNDLTRIATIKNTVFPVVGPIITTF